jgi:hypothetical protein
VRKKVIKIEGAYSNQVIKCIIYTNDIEIGINKLLEIEKEKNLLGIKTTTKRMSGKYFIAPSEIRFDDGEEWIIVKPVDGARGYRWRKAWVDVKTSIEMLECLILPCGSYINGRMRSILTMVKTNRKEKFNE